MTRTIWIACAAALVLAFAARVDSAEVCGDRLDNDGNGMTDEGCYPAQQTGVCESPLSCLDTGWVSWATGSLRYDLPPDVAPNSPWGPQIGLRRIYTSQYAPPSTPSSFNRTPLGPRWQHNYMSWIDRTPNGDFVIHTAQGEDVLVNGETWVPQHGYHVHFFQHDEFGYTVATIDGLYLNYNTLGQLVTIIDRFNNNIRLTWTTTPGGSVVSTVTDATNARRLSFGYTASLLTSVDLQLRSDGAWTTFHTTTYVYAGGALASVKIGGQLAQNNIYTGGYLTQINDGEGRRIAAFKFASARPGEADLIETAQGTVGFEFGSTRAVCQSNTVLYFNKANENSCSSDADCGSGALCGGKAGATGTCFRGARCLTVDSRSGQSLVTNVSSIGPASETCTGACAEVTQYVWNLSTLDLGAVKDALGSYTTTEYNSYGLPTKIVYADTGASPQNGGGQQTVYLSYSGSLLKRIRRPSAMDGGANCTDTQDSRCAITDYYYFDNGAVQNVTRWGYTLSSTGGVVGFSYYTLYTYDTLGRITSIDGPLDGDYDKTLFTYHSSADPTQNGFLATRVTRGTVPNLGFPIFDQVYRYDFWGNPIEWLDLNSQRSCQTYDAARNYLTKSSIEMTGGAGRCDLDDPADLIEQYTRDSALRLTRTTRPDGSCVDFEYDGIGRLARTTLRDDCDPARSSPGDRVEYTYDADGLLTGRTTYDAAGTVKHKALATYYDSRRLQSVPNPVDPSKVATLDYDERGVITAINGEQNLGRTQFDVDANYQVRSVARFNTPTTSDTWRLGYDRLGRRTTVTDPDSKSLVTTYDDLGRPVRQVSPDQTSMNVDRSFNALSRVQSETNLMQTRRFTYDPLGRVLTADYAGDCGDATRPEAEFVYDALQGRTCPSAQGCFNLKGRLAYSRITLMCGGPDGTLDQETFYSYDPAGRLIGEYIRDDTPRVADETYAWTKSGTLAQVTLPSGAALGWTHGGATSNSDTDRVTAVWRTTAATPIVENVQWNPFGPLKQYDRRDKIVGSALRMRIERNLAYRIRGLALEGQTLGGPYYSLALTEDATGRVTKRDYYPSDPQMAGVFDSYFLYDGQDRLLCEATMPMTTCPTSGATIKNNHLAAFTGAGDRKTLLRPVAGSSGGLSNVFALAPGTHRIGSVAQPDGATPLGITTYTYDALGRRTSEDNTGPRTSRDRRAYTYDGRGNLVGVNGTAPIGGAWHDYYMQSAFDTRNRRVFKAVLDVATQKQQHWFFYYDAYDRLTEVRYIPDVSVPAPTPFTTYQLIWLDDLLVGYWQTDSPSGTTSKRYTSFDETGRPVRMHSWETGDSRLVWAINPDAWGMDTVVIGSGVYQPIGFAGQYVDAETESYLDDGTTRNRPGLVLNGFRTYDPFTGSYLQIDPLVEQTWNAYGYADGNPVGDNDPTGLATQICRTVSYSEWLPGPWDWPQEVVVLSEECWDTGPADPAGQTSARTPPGKRRRGVTPPRPERPAGPPKKPDSADPNTTTCQADLAWLRSSDRAFEPPRPIHNLGPRDWPEIEARGYESFQDFIDDNPYVPYFLFKQLRPYSRQQEWQWDREVIERALRGRDDDDSLCDAAKRLRLGLQ